MSPRSSERSYRYNLIYESGFTNPSILFVRSRLQPQGSWSPYSSFCPDIRPWGFYLVLLLQRRLEARGSVLPILNDIGTAHASHTLVFQRIWPTHLSFKGYGSTNQLTIMQRFCFFHRMWVYDASFFLCLWEILFLEVEDFLGFTPFSTA